jgi:hypothetical protein
MDSRVSPAHKPIIRHQNMRGSVFLLDLALGAFYILFTQKEILSKKAEAG